MLYSQLGLTTQCGLILKKWKNVMKKKCKTAKSELGYTVAKNQCICIHILVLFYFFHLNCNTNEQRWVWCVALDFNDTCGGWGMLPRTSCCLKTSKVMSAEIMSSLSSHMCNEVNLDKVNILQPNCCTDPTCSSWLTHWGPSPSSHFKGAQHVQHRLTSIKHETSNVLVLLHIKERRRRKITVSEF